MGANLYQWAVNAYQGQFHKLFGHPEAAMELEGHLVMGVRTVVFRCKECGRSFEKVVTKWC